MGMYKNNTVQTEVEKKWHRDVVYEYLFYMNKQWTFPGQSIYFQGELIHYSEFMKAKRGTL